MKEPKDNLQPETIDQVIDGAELSSPDHLTTHMIQQLHLASRASAQENQQSLERIWERMRQSHEHPILLPPQWDLTDEKQPGGQLQSKRKVIQIKKTSWRTKPSFSLAQPKKRHTLVGIVGITLIAAVAVMTITSFALFSKSLHLATVTTSSKPSPVAPVQPMITRGSLTCSTGTQYKMIQAIPDQTRVVTTQQAEVPLLAWSSQGQVTFVTATTLNAFSAQNCALTSSHSIVNQYASSIWSPDGQKLALVDEKKETLNVLDRQGNLIMLFPLTQLGTYIFSPSWSSDSKQLTFATVEPNKQETIKRIEVTKDARATTLMTLPISSVNNLLISPAGTVFALYSLDAATNRQEVQIYDIATGKMMSHLVIATSHVYAQSFSPDGSLFAVGTVAGTSNQVQIYNTRTGKLVSSFEDRDATPSVVKSLSSWAEDPLVWQSRNLVWSPDGQYLAESTNAIHIYAVNARKIVATFGRVNDQDWIDSLAWSSDSKGLVSYTSALENSDTADIVNVWQLK